MRPPKGAPTPLPRLGSDGQGLKSKRSSAHIAIGSPPRVPGSQVDASAASSAARSKPSPAFDPTLSTS